MTSSPFDHPLFRGLLGDPEIEPLLSAETEIVLMSAFEIALAKAQMEQGVIPPAAGEAIGIGSAAYAPTAEDLAQGMAQDGVAGPAFVRGLRAAVGEAHERYVHFGATSQDITDSVLMVRLKMITAILGRRIGAIESELQRLASSHGSDSLIGRTRMQAAMPIAVADRLRSWWGPLSRARARLPADAFAVQLGGPVGTLREMGDAGPSVRAALATTLDLADAPSWHNQRDRVVRIASWFADISGAIGKIGQDIALMAQMGEVTLSGAGGSSSMPHKQNPVKAEVLVALARYNGVLIGAMHQGMVHEQERSGAAWTVEWLALPQMAVTTGTATRLLLALLGQVEGMGSNG
jgi:3-carboxy-cis,cis-muconate cycloisomerase